jgi:hypothetical protein
MALTQVKSDGIADGAVTTNDLSDSGVTAGTYGSSSAIPAITVDAKGRITSATTSAIDSTSIANGTSNVSVAASGDITATRAGTTRLTVHSAGATVNGTLSSDGIIIGDGDQIIVGDSNDFRIYHNGSRSIVQDQGTGSLEILATNFVVKNAADNKNSIFAIDGGATILYHNGTEKITTTSGGIEVTGTVTCDGLTNDGTSTFNGGAGAVTIATNSDIRFGATGGWSGNDVKIQHHANILYIGIGASGIVFREDATDRCQIDGDGHFKPASNNTYDLGTSSLRWRNVYTNDLNLSNEGGANDVDGTWGSWTIQEGEDELFLLNRRNGKKYKFNLSEVN